MSGHASLRYFSLYLGNKTAKELSSTSPPGFSSFSNLGIAQWSMPSWSQGLSFRNWKTRRAKERKEKRGEYLSDLKKKEEEEEEREVGTFKDTPTLSFSLSSSLSLSLSLCLSLSHLFVLRNRRRHGGRHEIAELAELCNEKRESFSLEVSVCLSRQREKWGNLLQVN